MNISNKVKPPKKATKKELINTLISVKDSDTEFLKVFTYERLNRGFTVEMLELMLRRAG
jgi:hypothetical protein